MPIDRSTKTPLVRLIRMMLLQPLWAVPFALFFGTLYGPGTFGGYLRAYQMSLIFAYSIGVAIWVIAAFVMPRLERSGSGASLGVQIGLCFMAAAIIGSYVAAFIIHFTIFPGFMGSWRSIVISGLFALLFSGLFAGFNYAIVFYRMAVERARAVEQARAELAQAELRALRAQINPHFLFNTLNSIASLIASNPGAAEETTTRLAEVFRYALQASEREHAPLGRELEFVRSLLAIERTRFAGRLRIEESIEPGLEAVPVPTLLLQPVVENAVRHGVSDRPGGGSVRIAVRRDGDRLLLEVTDDGAGMDAGAAPSGTGFGLHSVRERLRAAGPPHALEIESAPGRGTRVRIVLPLPPSTSVQGATS
jgi:sensor histidine kinase YesM